MADSNTGSRGRNQPKYAPRGRGGGGGPARPAQASAPSESRGGGNNNRGGGRGRGGNRGRGRGRGGQSPAFNPDSAPFVPSDGPVAQPTSQPQAQHDSQDRSGSQSRDTTHQTGSAGANASPTPAAPRGPPKAHKNVNKPNKRRGAEESDAPVGSGGRGRGRRGGEGQVNLKDFAETSTPKKRSNLASFNDAADGNDEDDSNPGSSDYFDNEEEELARQMHVTSTSAAGGHNQHAEDRGHHHKARISTEGQSELATKIISDLMRNKYECAVCFTGIKKQVATWACTGCWSLYHVYCIRKWARSQQTSASASASDDSSNNIPWSCPKCRAPYKGAIAYKCFCGKVKDPQFDPILIPHSCGEICNRVKGPECPHTCNLLCHPGPCPPCSSMGPLKSCFCGKTKYQLRCSVEDPGRSCAQPCGKKLSCGRHNCTQPCHGGPCKPCEEPMKQKCYCGQHTESRTCGSELFIDTKIYGPSDPRYFSCQSTCGRLLSCGHHNCEEKCHSDLCQPCKLLPAFVSSCPCGQTPLGELLSRPRLSCVDPIPTCTKTCNKLLKCGKHRCQKGCHSGDCQTCTEIVDVPCRCASTHRKMPCIDVYPDKLEATVAEIKCKRICSDLRLCGRHQCGLECCAVQRNPQDPDGLHFCRLPCNKRLPCGKHQCSQPCHKGKCGRCLEAVFNDIICPCGRTIQHAPIPCGTPPLKCPYDCNRRRPCGHPNSQHPCHEGDCPPCVHFVERFCQGGHVLMKNVPCWRENVSCGATCNKQMQCGLHSCPKPCHIGGCELAISEQEQERRTEEETEFLASNAVLFDRASCGHPCGLRLKTCEHLCQAACHPKIACPPRTCTQKSRVTCECKRLSAEVSCIGLSNFKLDCDSRCELEKRNKRLAEALGIAGPTQEYSDLLLNFAKASPQFVAKLEKLLESFIKTPNTPKTTLPPMERVQRQFVHELAKYWGLETESFDTRDVVPLRSIELTKKRDAHVPAPLLAQAAGISEANLSGVPSTLHFYDLHKGVLTKDINQCLGSFFGEYTLQWIDEENCLAIFKSPNLMQRALNTISRGIYRVKPYSDSTSPQGGNPVIVHGIAVLGSTRKPRDTNAPARPWSPTPAGPPLLPSETDRPLTFNPTAQQDRAWDKNDNPFAALSSDYSAALEKQTDEAPKSFVHTSVTASEANWEGSTPTLGQSSDLVRPLATAATSAATVDDWTSLLQDEPFPAPNTHSGDPSSTTPSTDPQ